MGIDLLNLKVPTKWTAIWEGPELPNNWIKGFCKRVYSLKRWVDKTKQGGLLDEMLNLNDLFHPEIFLNALR